MSSDWTPDGAPVIPAVVASSTQEHRLSFQPFVVQCQTCGSQLRVADPAIVGTIAACPKCNSMVQIERPGHRVAVGGSSIDSQAITEEAISAAEGASLGSVDSTTSGFTGDEATRSGLVEPASMAPMPPPWQSDRTQRSRQIALVVAVSLSSLLVAIAGFWWFVQSSRSRRAGTESSQQHALPNGAGQQDVDVIADDANASPVAQPDDVPSRNQASTEHSDAEHSDADPIVDPDASINPDATSIAKVPDTSDPSDITSPPAGLIPGSPLDPPSAVVPVPPTPQVPTGAVDNEPTAGGMQELPPELAKYTKFLLEEGSTEKPTLQAPPTMDEVTIEAAADEIDDPTITVRPKEANLKADLAIRMALDTKGYPLPDLVLLISQITGVPIQIDWVSFDLAGIDLHGPVTTRQGWQTVREILDAAAAGLGAELREEETLVIITLTDEAFDQQLSLLADLSDFGDGQASAKQVLIDFLRGEGEESGNEVPLGVSRDDRQISAISVDALRRMRGLTPRIADDRMHRWAWSSSDPTGEWTPVIGGEAGPQLDTPIAMADFLRRTAKRNGTSILVNWYDFARRSAAPEHLLIPHAEADAGKTLDRLLHPLGLQARQVDSNHWWLGRESTYDRLPAIIWTPPLGNHRERFVEELSNVMTGAMRDAFRVTIDPQSDRALILLPRFIVRQLAKLADGVAAK